MGVSGLPGQKTVNIQWGERGIGVSINRLDGTKAILTDVDGRYIFPQAQIGQHELSAELNTIPVLTCP